MIVNCEGCQASDPYFLRIILISIKNIEFLEKPNERLPYLMRITPPKSAKC